MILQGHLIKKMNECNEKRLRVLNSEPFLDRRCVFCGYNDVAQRSCMESPFLT